jgi:hypothetical protein|tara:strand:+ start:6202 stop:6312 length:111 start_codon:yes stop_codon:yes gene_type:complete
MKAKKAERSFEKDRTRYFQRDHHYQIVKDIGHDLGQ